MAYRKQEVLLYKQQGDDFSTTPITLTDCYDIQVEQNLADKKDVLKFKLMNANNKYFNSDNGISVGDNVKVYLWENSATYSDLDLAIDAIISDPPISIDTKGKIISVTAYSKIGMIFTSLIFIKQDDLTTPNIIVQILKSSNQTSLLGSSSSRKIRYTYVGSDGDTIYNEEDVAVGSIADDDLPSIAYQTGDGDTFTKETSVREIYRPASWLLKNYSGDDYTNDGAYIMYLDSSNTFYWKPPARSVTGAITEGTNMESATVKISSDDVINAAIINIGNSPSGRGNTTYVVNPVSLTKHGAKWRYITQLRGISEELMTMEEIASPALFNKGDKFPTSYPYTTQKMRYKDNATVSCANDAAYEDVIREEANYVGKYMGAKLLALWANPRIEISADIRQDLTSYQVGDFIPFTVPSYNVTENLRVKKIVHDIWGTNVVGIQDVEDANEGGI